MHDFVHCYMDIRRCVHFGITTQCIILSFRKENIKLLLSRSQFSLSLSGNMLTYLHLLQHFKRLRSFSKLYIPFYLCTFESNVRNYVQFGIMRNTSPCTLSCTFETSVRGYELF